LDFGVFSPRAFPLGDVSGEAFSFFLSFFEH
jgi:hypothetical protein